MTRVLVLGAGGREHALAWRLAREGVEVAVAPGNPFIAARLRTLPVPDDAPPALVALAERERAELVVIGPEALLAAGVADALAARDIPVYGPSAAAARLETSKAFAKDVMRAAGVATAEAARCATLAEVERAFARFGAPHVIKADGLAAGKGVCVTEDRNQARTFASRLLATRDGTAVLVEEFLAGEEASVMAVCDGERFVLLPAARDYKRAQDGDRGPNTGGMGAFAPLARVDGRTEQRIGQTIVEPVLREMAERGSPFRGTLYAGLMLSDTNDSVRVVEFNARFGDPETQVVLPLVGGRFSELLASSAKGALEAPAISRAAGAAVAVALVEEHYPDGPSGGAVIEGLDAIADRDGIMVFGAGLAAAPHGWQVCGGRAAYVMAVDEELETARVRAYRAIEQLGGTGWRVRRDIAGVEAAHERGSGRN